MAIFCSLVLAASGAFAASAKYDVALGGIIDKHANLGFFRAMKTGIDAIDLQTGNLIWHSDLNAVPIAVSGKNLVVLSRVKNGTNVVSLSEQDGHQTQTSETVPNLYFADGWGSGHMERATLNGRQLQIDWETSTHPVWGNPPANYREIRGTEAWGTFVVDMKTGKVSQPSPAIDINKDQAKQKEMQAWAANLAPPEYPVGKIALRLMQESGERLVLQAFEPGTKKVLWNHDVYQARKISHLPI